MELMRQRVKSSPLLLEGGSTPWTNVSTRPRIRHNCSSENMANYPRRQKRLKNYAPRSVSCCLSESNNTAMNSTIGEVLPRAMETKPPCKDEETQTQAAIESTAKSEEQARKFRTIYRIYASHGCEEPDKRKLARSGRAKCCKCSQERPPTPIVTCRRLNPCKTNIHACRKEAVRNRSARQSPPDEIDSGDELCSLDRALL